MCLAGIAEGPKIWGARHYKLSISLSIYISGGGTLFRHVPSTHPVPPALMDIRENAKVKKAKSKKQNLYNPCPSIIHYVSHVCGTLDLQILVVALQKKIQGQSLRHVLLKIKKKSERPTFRLFSEYWSVCWNVA